MSANVQDPANVQDSAPLFKAPLCVLDTETTGFDFASYAEVIELAAVILNPDGTERASFSSFVKPTVLDDRANPALAINHITHADLERAPDAMTVALRFARFLSDHGATYCTSYNIDFDRRALDKMGLELQWASCILKRAKEDMGPKKSHSAAAAAAHYRIVPHEPAHRALADARTAADICKTIQRRKIIPAPL